MITELEKELLKCDKQFWAKRYIKFVRFCEEYNREKESDYYELHHIIPRSLNKARIKDKNNIIRLTGRQHFIAHFILAKIYAGRMLFAFNQMKRVGNKKSILYHAFRKELSCAISESGKGRKMSEENRKKKSAETKGTVIVRYKDDIGGDGFRVSVDDERYLSGELVFVNTGNKHSESTRQKMSDNGIKGKNAYNNGVNNIFLREGETVPEGYTYGAMKQPNKICTNVKWCHNPATKENIRIEREAEVPEGFVEGKYTEIGFSLLNNTIRVYNFADHKTHTYSSIEEIDLPDFTYMRLNELTSSDKTEDGGRSLHIYNGYVASSRKNFNLVGISNGKPKVTISSTEVDLSKHKVISLLLKGKECLKI